MFLKILAAAALAVVVAAVCLSSPLAQSAPKAGQKIVDASTANPAVGTCKLGNYSSALLVVAVDDGGAHAVTVHTRACVACPWVAESALSLSVSPSEPAQLRVVGWFESVRITVANASADTVDAWCSLVD
jgi:hypothetical protein